MFRLKLVVIVVGAVIGYLGFQEFRVSQGTTVEPTAVDLATLESGEQPPNNHVMLGEHFAVHGASVYEYSQSKYATGAPGNSTKVNHVYYPAVSTEHSYIQKLAELSEIHEDLDQVPDSEWPAFDKFRVVVKTKKFETIGSIPDGMEVQPQLQGLIVNQIGGLDSEEEELLRSSFPGTNVDDILVIEAGRKPASLFKSLGMMGGGGLLALIGIGSFFVGRDSV